MRQEQVFSKGGIYGFAVQCNALLHREAIEHGTHAIQTSFAEAENRTLRVLDLACGGLPISISKMMGNCPEFEFCYTGVDINPDQVQAAREFEFPANVVSAEIIEGDAWNLAHLSTSGKFDIAFEGLNLHHGSPRECLFLLNQLRNVLSEDGVFINHDSYRPNGAPFRHRPPFNPGNSSEPMAFISEDLLADLDEADQCISNRADSNTDWRANFAEEFSQLLKDRGGDEAGANSAAKHILERDYPLTVHEMAALAKLARMETQIISYSDSDEPLRHYYQMLLFRRQQ
jgi:SAM-dependent methyltransferase